MVVLTEHNTHVFPQSYFVRITILVGGDEWCRDSYKVCVTLFECFDPRYLLLCVWAESGKNHTPSGCIWKSSHRCKVISLEKKEDLATLVLHSHFPSHLFWISARSSPKCDYFCPHFRQVIFPLALPLAHICFHLFLSSSQISSPPLHQYLSDSLCFPSHSLFSPFPSLTPVLPPSVPPSFPLPLMALSPDLLQFTLSYLWLERRIKY